MSSRSSSSTPFPYTTLFRSPAARGGAGGGGPPPEPGGAFLRAVRRAGAGHPGRSRNALAVPRIGRRRCRDRKSTRLNSSHVEISYAVFRLKKKNIATIRLVL